MRRCGCNYNSEDEEDEEECIERKSSFIKKDNDNNLIEVEENKKIMSRFDYYMLFSVNIFMTFANLLSPILIYYPKRYQEFIEICFNPYKLLFLIIFNIANTFLKFILLEKLNSYECCIKRLYDIAFVYSDSRKDKLNENIQKFKRKFFAIYFISIFLLIFISVEFEILKIFDCTNIDIIGYFVARMFIFSVFIGVLFNFYEFCLIYSLIVKRYEKLEQDKHWD